ncbi:hypothetical protein HMPREF9946_00971 [Acetobacteraceae bacterium AT-5844]|nr:hypothetical protein HMPREF9946_00971 [Acetobacteraceae bacterium AT-5844]
MARASRHFGRLDVILPAGQKAALALQDHFADRWHDIGMAVGLGSPWAWQFLRMSQAQECYSEASAGSSTKQRRELITRPQIFV